MAYTEDYQTQNELYSMDEGAGSEDLGSATDLEEATDDDTDGDAEVVDPELEDDEDEEEDEDI